MKKSILFLFLVVLGSEAAGQAPAGVAAPWQGMLGTPVGAFPAIEAPALTRADVPQLAFRLSTRTFEGGSAENSYGVTAFSRGSSRLKYGGTMGWTQGSRGTASASGGVFLIGGELAGSFWNTDAPDASPSMSIGWKGSVGLGHTSGSPEGNLWSYVAQLPLRATIRMSSQSDLSAFVSPGFGMAGFTDTGPIEAESGTFPMISAGAAWATGSLGIHVGVQRVQADLGTLGDSPWIGGVSVTFPAGRKR
jgi:hypothetical protein